MYCVVGVLFTSREPRFCNDPYAADRRIKRTSRNAEAKVSTESSECLVSTCLGDVR